MTGAVTDYPKRIQQQSHKANHLHYLRLFVVGYQRRDRIGRRIDGVQKTVRRNHSLPRQVDNAGGLVEIPEVVFDAEHELLDSLHDLHIGEFARSDGGGEEQKKPYPGE